MKELTDEQFDELKSHSQMLGVIGMYVEDFCEENDTTLVGVMRLLAEYHSMKTIQLYNDIDERCKQP